MLFITLSGKLWSLWWRCRTCIDLFYFFKLTPCRWEDYGEIQPKLDLDGVAFLRHVESGWPSLLPAVERVKGQFQALLEYFKKLPETDKKIKINERYKKIMTFFKSPETVVRMCFLESSKPVFDQSPDISSRRTFNLCFVSKYAASVEAGHVQILEAEWNSGEDCKWTAEVGLKKRWNSNWKVMN